MKRIPLLTALVSAGLALAAAAQDAPIKDLEHFTTIEDAVKASKGKKDIIVDFTGSDWCGWCKKLVAEVFDTGDWKKAAADKYVFVEIDFPQKKKQTDEEKKYNKALGEKFGVQGYPTIFVLDAAGNPYGKTGYQAGGPSGYLEHLAELAKSKNELADLRAKYDAEKDAAAKVKALAAYLAKTESAGVGSVYGDLKEQLVTLDEKNVSGKRGEFAAKLAIDAKHQGRTDRFEKFLKIAQQADPLAAQDVEVTIKFEDEIAPLFKKGAWDKALAALEPMMTKYAAGRAGQQVFFYAGVAQFRSDNKEEAVKLLEKALSLAPDSDLVPNIKQVLSKAKKVS